MRPSILLGQASRGSTEHMCHSAEDYRHSADQNTVRPSDRPKSARPAEQILLGRAKSMAQPSALFLKTLLYAHDEMYGRLSGT